MWFGSRSTIGGLVHLAAKSRSTGDLHPVPGQTEKDKKMIKAISARDAGRLQKALGQVSHYYCGIMTLGEFLERHTWEHKEHKVRTHARQKIGGSYAKLANPVHEYTLWRTDDQDRKIGIMVPKLVWDHTYGHLPEKKRD